MRAGRRSGSRILWARDGVRMRMACGRFIRERATRGCRLILGGGCRITPETGRSFPGMDGVGSRVGRGTD